VVKDERKEGNMKSLPESFVKNSFHYIKFKENEHGFIFKQFLNNKLEAFEVFRRKNRKERVINGRTLPAKIQFPHDEAFGKWAWSFAVFDNEVKAREKALVKFSEISGTIQPSKKKRELNGRLYRKVFKSENSLNGSKKIEESKLPSSGSNN
jgi:hypothetical protein